MHLGIDVNSTLSEPSILQDETDGPKQCIILQPLDETISVNIDSSPTRKDTNNPLEDQGSTRSSTLVVLVSSASTWPEPALLCPLLGNDSFQGPNHSQGLPRSSYNDVFCITE